RQLADRVLSVELLQHDLDDDPRSSLELWSAGVQQYLGVAAPLDHARLSAGGPRTRYPFADLRTDMTARQQQSAARQGAAAIPDSHLPPPCVSPACLLQTPVRRHSADHLNNQGSAADAGWQTPLRG